MIQQLISNLQQQLEHHSALLEVLTEESLLPASCELKQMEHIQMQRNTLTGILQDLEQQRLKIVRSLTEQFGIAASSSIKDLSSYCQNEEKEELLNLKNDLKDIVMQIKSIGKKNADRANARIACFHEIQSAIHKSFKRQPTYSVNGNLTQPKGACLVAKSI